MATPLDDIDRRILDELREDGRMSMRTLAEQLHVSRANAYARVDRLETAGVIRGFRADVDPVPAAWPPRRTSRSTCGRPTGGRSASGCSAAGIAHIGLVGGEFDVILLVRARDNADLRRLVLDEIQGMDGRADHPHAAGLRGADPPARARPRTAPLTTRHRT